MITDDLHLLQRTRRGDEAAARELWSRFAPRMLAYARGVLGRSHADAADDIVQSVFVSVLTRPRRQLRTIEDVPAWMLRCTRNAAINHLRGIRRDRARCARTSVVARVDGATPPLRRDPGTVSAAIDALPRRHREPLILKHVAGLTFDQLALALGINRNTAAARYRAALTILRQTLGTEEALEENHA